MKTKIVTLTLLTTLFAGQLFAQDRTTVNATSSEVSDNLDLRAVASIFGDASNLEDFERRLNDPELQISNLDLNQDNQVDYLRVIESVEGNTHLIVIQSVLGRDVFQDVATVEVERDRNNRVQVQVVGDVYMYGNNYIYEPVYVQAPVIYNYFWAPSYRPYCSTWYWGYYPTYYYAWTPFPIFSYRNHIGIAINFNHHYNYVNYRSSQVAYNMHRGRRSNGYEIQHPNRSFNQRNEGYSNRHELNRTRTTRNGGTRNEVANYGTRNNGNRDLIANNPRTQRSETLRGNGNRDVTANNPRTQRSETPRGNGNRDVTANNPRTQRSETPRGNGNRDLAANNPRTQRNETPRGNGNRDVTTNNPRTQRSETPRGNSDRDVTANNPRTQRSETPRGNSDRDVTANYPKTQNSETSRNYENRNSTQRTESPRNYDNQNATQRNSSSREFSQQRNETQRSAPQREFSQQRNASPRNESQRNQGNSNGSRRG